MKILFILSFLFFITTQTSYSQQKIYNIQLVDKAPRLKYCDSLTDNSKTCFIEGLKQHINKEFNIMNLIKAQIYAGKASIQFKILASGKISEVKVQAKRKKMKEESIRVIKNLEVLRPAMLDGKKVAMVQVIPIEFKTKHFESYSEMIADNEAVPGIVSVEEVQKAPLYRECQSIMEIECFKHITINKIYTFLSSNKLFRGKIKKGDVIKFYFDVDKDGKVFNPVIAFKEKMIRDSLNHFLMNLEFKSPAKDRDGNPLPIYYQDELTF